MAKQKSFEAKLITFGFAVRLFVCQAPWVVGKLLGGLVIERNADEGKAEEFTKLE